MKLFVPILHCYTPPQMSSGKHNLLSWNTSSKIAVSGFCLRDPSFNPHLMAENQSCSEELSWSGQEGWAQQTHILMAWIRDRVRGVIEYWEGKWCLGEQPGAISEAESKGAQWRQVQSTGGIAVTVGPDLTWSLARIVEREEGEA